MAQFHLRIVTPDGLRFDGMAESILVRTESGDVQIMRGHAEFFAPLGIGLAKLIADGKERIASASGGFISVEKGEVNLVATTFEFSDEIDLKRAEAAKENAEKVIHDSASDERTVRIARAKLARAINRINTANYK